jgi:hypothetical protein
VLGDGLLDELLGQFGAFPVRDHPAGDVAAEDVQDDVEIEAELVNDFETPARII